MSEQLASAVMVERELSLRFPDATVRARDALRSVEVSVLFADGWHTSFTLCDGELACSLDWIGDHVVLAVNERRA